MGAGTDVRALTVAAATLLPAVLAWLLGRRLARRAGSDDVPERLALHRRRLFQATGLSLGVLSYAAGVAAVPLGLVSLVALVAASYPLRRALFAAHGETWGLLSYVSWTLRRSVAFLGFWLLLLASPYLVDAWPYRPALAGAALFAVLLAWLFLWGRLLSLLLRTRPLPDAELRMRFGEVASRARLPVPSVLVAGPEDGLWPNAMALPAAKGPGTVLISRTLLSRLTPAQVLSILAHELAHLADRTTSRKRSALVTGLLYAATILPALFKAEAPRALAWLEALWIPAVLLLAVVGAARRRRHEADCDQKAGAWTGDPESLATALEELYRLALLPRRWPASFEAMATHPSLEDRVRALRGQPAEGESARRPDGLSWLFLVRALALASGLVSFVVPGLAAPVAAVSAAVLVAVEAAPLAALGATALGWAAFAPGTRFLDPADAWRLPQVRLLMLGLGIVFAALAVARALSRPERRRTALVEAVTATAFVVAVSLAGLIWMAPLGALRAHQEALARPGLLAGLLGLAAALLAGALPDRERGRPVSRPLLVLGLAAAAACVGPLVLRSEGFLRRFGRDPLLPAAAAILRPGGPGDAAGASSAGPTPRAEVGAPQSVPVDVPGTSFVELRACAAGVFAVGEAGSEEGSIFLVLRRGGGRYVLFARQVRLLPDGRVLALVESDDDDEGSLSLCVLSAPSQAPGGESDPPVLEGKAVRPLASPRIEVDPGTGRSAVVGEDPRTEEPIVVEGPNVGPLEGATELVPGHAGGGLASRPATAVLTRDTEARTVLRRWLALLLGQPRPLTVSLIGFRQGPRLSASSIRSALDVQLVSPGEVAGGSDAVVSFDGFLTHVFLLGDASAAGADPARALRLLASLRGELRPRDVAAGRALLSRDDRLYLVGPGAGEVRELRAPGAPIDARLVPDGIAVLSLAKGGGRILTVLSAGSER